MYLYNPPPLINTGGGRDGVHVLLPISLKIRISLRFGDRRVKMDTEVRRLVEESFVHVSVDTVINPNIPALSIFLETYTTEEIIHKSVFSAIFPRPKISKSAFSTVPVI